IGGGDPTTDALVRGAPWPLVVLVLLLVVKLVLTVVSYGCGVPGGIFAPQLVLGAALGAILHALAPSLGGGGLGPGRAAAGMVGIFSAWVRAPLPGLVLGVELTPQSPLLLAQAIPALVGYLVAAGLRARPIYEALRARDPRRASSGI